MNAKFIFIAVLLTLHLAHGQNSFHKLQDQYEYAKQDHKGLRKLAVQGDWPCVQKYLEHTHQRYIAYLLKINFPPNFDPQGDKKRQLRQWQQEILVWKKHINETCVKKSFDSQKYGVSKAQQDIKTGNIQIFILGYPPQWIYTYQKLVKKKYNIKISCMGCITDAHSTKWTDSYNRVMYTHIDKTCGKNALQPLLEEARSHHLYSNINQLYDEMLIPLSLEGDWIKLGMYLNRHQIVEDTKLLLSRINTLTLNRDQKEKIKTIQRDIKKWLPHIREMCANKAWNSLMLLEYHYNQTAQTFENTLLTAQCKEALSYLNDCKNYIDRDQFNLLKREFENMAQCIDIHNYIAQFLQTAKLQKITQSDGQMQSTIHINEQQVRVGQQIKNIVVKNILKNKVVFEYKGRTFSILLDQKE